MEMEKKSIKEKTVKAMKNTASVGALMAPAAAGIFAGNIVRNVISPISPLAGFCMQYVITTSGVFAGVEATHQLDKLFLKRDLKKMEKEFTK